MKIKLSLLTCLFIVLCLCALSGCGDVDDEATNTSNANAAATPAAGKTTNTAAPAGQNANSAAPTSGGTKATGTLTANPNPVPVCGSATTGKTTIAWTQNGATHIQVRVESPDGGLLVDSTEPRGENVTGDWVLDGTKFFLQDVSSGKPATITTLTVKTTKEGCR